MDSKKRLDRLNAYLISKGRRPKSASPVDFVKQNISVAANVNSSVLRKSAHKVSTRTISSGCNRKSMKSVNKPLKPITAISAKSTMKKNGVESTSDNRRKQRKNNKENHLTKGKKDGGRPVDMVVKGQSRTTGKVTPKNSHAKINTVASVPRINSMSRQKMTGRSQCASANSTPVKHMNQRITYAKTGNAGGHYKKLNNWLLAKGKKPFGVNPQIQGFKAVKTIQTPVGSPAPLSLPQSPSVQTPSNTSHWQGLRDEDDLDEIAVLIRKAMGDVKNCIKEGCPPSILESTLEELAATLPTVKLHAPYWITLALIRQAAGVAYGKICDVYEKAIIAKAQPISDIQDALNEWLMNGVNGQEKPVSLDGPENAARSVPTNQSSMAHPALHKLKMTTSPVYKNAATSPIIFESPVRNRDESPSMPQSPSSVVKLRMVSKSSPVFNRIKSLRTLPESASAVITPVRRSTRIATAQHNYPIGLRDHEPCLSSVQEIFPALGYDTTNNSNSSSISCNVVFDPNIALDEENDIAKVLNF